MRASEPQPLLDLSRILSPQEEGLVNQPSIHRRFDVLLSGVVNARERAVLVGGLRGVEKESLRVTATGTIAQTPHPLSLGSALTHEHITTDYSEALIELVTPTFDNTWALIQYLTDLHQFVYGSLADERLWCTSMPARLDHGDADIPIAHYGSSNVGRLKTVYREGLARRYGRCMQAISGVHFNYSMPAMFFDVYSQVLQQGSSDQAFQSEIYFALLRNYRRHGWIIPYLFGASPVVADSFLANHPNHGLKPLGANTFMGAHATSLRMSDLGYRNREQADVAISVNSLDEYLRDMRQVLATPSPEFAAVGVKVDGQWRQLNANRLQIENEYYAFIRPKRVTQPGERPSKALRRAGVQYVEMRSLDVSVLDPVGVNQQKLRFLETFALFCAICPAEPMTLAEQFELEGNHVAVARAGRDPNLKLKQNNREYAMQSWGLDLLQAMEGIAELLDVNDTAKPYQAALADARLKLLDPTRTPSARVLMDLLATGESFIDHTLRLSNAYKQYFAELPALSAARVEAFADEVKHSLAAQQQLETQRDVSFDQYVADFLAE
jgi:glutamate--cysteine ligase